MLKTALAVICAFTLLATGYLSLSLLILHPPRANVPVWFSMAALFAAQSVLTLVALGGVVSGGWVRWVVSAGALAIAWVGASWVRDTLTSSHFEGYAVVLGSMLVVQGALTLVGFLRQHALTVFTAPQR